MTKRLPVNRQPLCKVYIYGKLINRQFGQIISPGKYLPLTFPSFNLIFRIQLHFCESHPHTSKKNLSVSSSVSDNPHVPVRIAYHILLPTQSCPESTSTDNPAPERPPRMPSADRRYILSDTQCAAGQSHLPPDTLRRQHPTKNPLKNSSLFSLVFFNHTCMFSFAHRGIFLIINSHQQKFSAISTNRLRIMFFLYLLNRSSCRPIPF